MELPINHGKVCLELGVEPHLVDLASEGADDGPNIPRRHRRKLGEDEFVDEDGLEKGEHCQRGEDDEDDASTRERIRLDVP